MIHGITDLGTFVLGTIFIILLPGPNSLYVMTVASRRGIAAGYRGACGIFAGDTVLMLLAAGGAASLLRARPELFLLLRAAGALYLAWLGLGLLRSAWIAANRPASEDPPPAVEATRPFRTALLISLLNPKAILFFVSFFIQFVAPDAPYPALSFLILGGIVQFFSALYLSALILGGAGLARQFRERRRWKALATGSGGLLFIGFGLRLASAGLG